MSKTALTRESEFVVREEKVLVYILAALFFALFLYGMIDAIQQNFIKVNYQSFIFLLALVPAIFLFLKGYRNKIHLRVNKKGIFQNEQLVTNWPGFINAYITQKKTVISIQDNFLLVVEFLNRENKKVMRRTIPLTNTQNKSEEEVKKAISFFWKEFKQGLI